MPMVIKRDETSKSPKDRGKANAAAAVAAAKPAQKAATKPAAGTKTAAAKGKKGAASEKNETMKLVIGGVATVLALGFLIWYFFTGSPENKEVGGNGTTTTAGAGSNRGTPGANPAAGGGTGRSGGISTVMTLRRK